MLHENFPPSVWRRLRDWGQMAQRMIDLRLALIVGVLAFWVAVSFDSGGNLAAAADLTMATTSTAVTQSPLPSDDGPVVAPDPLAALGGLHSHRAITRATVTKGHLTRARLVTSRPSGEAYP